jgi:hypothetical protein
MPAPSTVITPTQAPTNLPVPEQNPGFFPDEICTQQKRELASPDVSP